MRLVVDSGLLAARALRESIRMPAFEISNIFIPLFFFAVSVGAISRVAESAFGVHNFTGFQMPVAILQATASTANGAGLGMTQDIQRGYFDKLLLTSTPRLALVIGRMLADAVRAMVFTAIIVAVGVAVGGGLEAGIPGGIAILLLAGSFAFVYSGFGLAIALRTGSPQAAQAGFLLFFPLLFLAPAFAPKTVFTGWLEFAATINPVTYLLTGMRELILDGWGWDSVGKAFASIAGIGVVTTSMTVLALRWRQAGA